MTKIWLGVSNVVAGIFGGQGGNSEIGLTLINIHSGARLRVTTLTLTLTMSCNAANSVSCPKYHLSVYLAIALVIYDFILTKPDAGFQGVCRCYSNFNTMCHYVSVPSYQHHAHSR